MPLKFRLKGLAETFLDALRCSACGNEATEQRDQGFSTDLTRVTFDGIIVVVECERCGHISVPDNQRMGILNSQRLRDAVQQDCLSTGQPLFRGIQDVKLEVERLNAERQDLVQ